MTIFPESLEVEVQVGTVDIIQKDKNGNVIRDTRAERIAQKHDMAELMERHSRTDPLVSAIMDSYSAAVLDPANELVHLYEIREALAKHFGDSQNARTQLSVTRARWSRLGQLANDEPIRQGRHRGKDLGALRDATEDEIKESRSLARELIEHYLMYLEQQNTSGP